MKYGVFQDFHPFGKLLLALFLMGSIYLIMLFLSSLLAAVIYQVGFSDILDIIQGRSYREHIGLMKFLQICYSAGLFLIPACLTGFFISGSAFTYLNAKKKPLFLTLILVVLLVLSAVPLLNLLVEFNMHLSLPEKFAGLEDKIHSIEDDAEEMMNDFLSTTNLWGFTVNLLMIAIIPALGEEFLFRGVLQRIFAEWFRNVHIAILVTAVLFSTFHFQFLGFIPRFVLGVIFGYLLVWTGTIWVPVIAHFVNNAVAVVFYFLFNKGLIQNDLEYVGTSQETLFMAGISLLVVVLILAGIWYREVKYIN